MITLDRNFGAEKRVRRSLFLFSLFLFFSLEASLADGGRDDVIRKVDDCFVEGEEEMLFPRGLPLCRTVGIRQRNFRSANHRRHRHQWFRALPHSQNI